MSSAVIARSLSKTYRSNGQSIIALDDVSLSVEEGSIFAFLGPNGSGKTTLMNIVSGVLDPDSTGSPSVEILGIPRMEAGYFDRVSFMSGDSEYFWSFTGEEILRFYAQLNSVPNSRVGELVDEFGLGPKVKRKWIEYSDGEKTRLRLIKALLKEPRVLFLDEPTVGLDPDISDLVREKLRALNRAGLTVFLTSHYMKDIEELADTVCFIHKGKIHATGPLHSFRRAKPFIEVEYLNSERELVPILDVTQIHLREGIRSIRSQEESLEEYFISLVRGEE